MRIAIVNPMTKTVDNPQNILKAVNFPKPYIETDEDSNIVELGVELTKLGHEVTVYASDVFSPAKSIDDKIEGLSVRYLPTKLTTLFPYLYFPFTPTLYGELLSNKYDVVQSSEFFQIGTIISALAASKRNFPVVIWHELGVQQRFPGNLFQEIYSKTLGKFVLRRICCFIPRSCAARDWLLHRSIPEDKIWSVVHTGINTKEFFPLRNNLQIKTKLGVPEDNVLIVSVGRLHSFKGFNYLIRAMRFVVNKYSKVSLIIRGDGPQALYLNNLTETLKLQKHVKIISKRLSRSELNELYNASDFTALPSTKELFPNFSIIESLACGKPAIHSSLGGERDLGGNGYASFCVKYGDVKSLTEMILYLIENSDIRKKMGKNALELVKEEYSLSVVATKFLKIYNIWQDTI
jgi:glycosyltransferase involved in cell wall biosynthesis